MDVTADVDIIFDDDQKMILLCLHPHIQCRPTMLQVFTHATHSLHLCLNSVFSITRNESVTFYTNRTREIRRSGDW